VQAPLNANELSLRDFLAHHPPVAALRVHAWRSENTVVAHCELQTRAWWSTTASRGPLDGRITIALRGIHSSKIDFGYSTMHIDTLSVATDDPRLWYCRRRGVIYANSNVPDPARLDAELSDAIVARHPGGMDVLFRGSPPRGWTSTFSQRAPFCLLAAPEPVIGIAQPILEAHGIEFVMFMDPLRKKCDGSPLVLPILVTIGKSWVICMHASVELWPPPS
jgi:hypothetical protein